MRRFDVVVRTEGDASTAQLVLAPNVRATGDTHADAKALLVATVCIRYGLRPSDVTLEDVSVGR